ncbi:unnamed protein product, partial [Meganyctiphanes norvegica]
QIPKPMTWKDVRNSTFPDNKSRKLWRDVFRTLSGLSEDDDKKKDVDDEKTQILVDAVQDFQLPPNLSLDAVKKLATSLKVSGLKKLNKKLKQLRRNMKRNMSKILLKVVGGLTGAPPGITITTASNGEQVVSIPKKTKWDDLRDSFSSPEEKKKWEQVIEVRR